MEYFKNLSNRAKIIWSLSVVGVIAIGVTAFIFLSPKQNAGADFQLKESEGVVTTTEPSSTTESSEKPSSYYNDTHARAVEKLEKPTEEISGEKREKVKAGIERAIAELKKNPENVGSVQGGYSPTTNDMVQVMHQALNAEYEVKIDTLTTTKSNYENIYQFAVDMVRKKDNHSVTVAGSYSEEMNQVQFSILVGNIQIQH
jgi:conserved hypothetical secreted protein